MRKFADLTEQEAMEFWADNLDILNSIYENPEIKKLKAQENKDQENNENFFKAAIKHCSKELMTMLKWIDDTPITLGNFMPRVKDLFGAFADNADFFTSPEQETEQTTSTSHSENTEESAQ